MLIVAPTLVVLKVTFVRVFSYGDHLRVELGEQPKPAQQRLNRLARILSRGRRPQWPPARGPIRGFAPQRTFDNGNL